VRDLSAKGVVSEVYEDMPGAIMCIDQGGSGS